MSQSLARFMMNMNGRIRPWHLKAGAYSLRIICLCALIVLGIERFFFLIEPRGSTRIVSFRPKQEP